MSDNHNQPPAREQQDAQHASDSSQDNNEPQRKRPGKKPLVILAIVVVIMLLVGLWFWFTTRNIESTDDAFTEGDAVTIAPKAAGYVVKLLVKDNQRVKQGDLLVEIDPRDTSAQRDQAKAQLGLAQAQLHQAQAQLALSRVQYPAQRDQALADQAKAQANLLNAQADYRRQRGVDPRATSQRNIDTAAAQLRSAEAQLQSAKAQVEVASQVQLQIRQQETNVEARQQQVEQAQAQLNTAELNLSYTQVRAPYDGFVTKRNVQVGTLVQAGTALFSLVSPDIWINANFKESQLARMNPGDKVDISIDAWPDMKLEGHVDSVQMGSGSRFSTFPAENATGNYVKIVQRVPVKIVIDKGLDPNHPLPLGLSVEPKVTVE
ncbi:HlyD family secretion protein [Pantoea sp. JGM49]|jgi:membrane fusion protein, multidrug efflux system|uniref:Multidrug export protein EmrA n=2 Tax=cellular organisms TaxID=131567 RepID=A0A8R2D7C4_ACYPI|nr:MULTISPECIES: HlyD family secretion protein [Pantoea]MBS0880038.1 HlyD family secretion protein [Pantoea sp. JGM49]MDI9279247.1 HlyD family secretion protein [Pantoea sp. EABMAA-21]MXP51493.1 HlyD family secretion protein [Pantoea sp. Seng]NIG18931.1 HlyD family secretion protein [Pantoea communis]SNY76497.1 membrane fusion protein, multidrug efflux system [Pantoea sp. GL120224-02]|eukprot:XP_016664665.1 PREDICTED: multidrug export protein EmrA-like [Acyrthosiphon pisum]